MNAAKTSRANNGDRAEVLVLYNSGVAAFIDQAAEIDGDDWSRPACGAWTAADLVRHVLSVIRWYHSWLDRALAGDAAKPFEVEDMSSQTSAALVAEGDLDPTAALSEFAKLAATYADRVSQAWDIPYGFPSGTVTAGGHLAVAALEWELHTFDLASVRDIAYVPIDPAGLLRHAGTTISRTEPYPVGWAMRRGIFLATRLQPWKQLLTKSGRR